MSKAKKGKGTGENNSQYGSKWIYNEKLNQCKKSSKQKIDKYLQEGWKLGRKIFT